MSSITVGGLPGTGTSTLCKLLAPATGLEYTYAGALFRAEAERRSMSLAEFGALCESDDSVDRGLDDQQRQLLSNGGVLLEGRMAGWLAHDDQADALRVWLVCDDDERLRRVLERDGGDAGTTRQAILDREASEAARYKRYYGADVCDLSLYHLVLNSTSQSPEQLAQAVLAARGPA